LIASKCPILAQQIHAAVRASKCETRAVTNTKIKNKTKCYQRKRRRSEELRSNFELTPLLGFLTY